MEVEARAEKGGRAGNFICNFCFVFAHDSYFHSNTCRQDELVSYWSKQVLLGWKGSSRCERTFALVHARRQVLRGTTPSCMSLTHSPPLATRGVFCSEMLEKKVVDPAFAMKQYSPGYNMFHAAHQIRLPVALVVIAVPSETARQLQMTLK